MSVLDRFRLEGRHAVVTGASRGLGRAAAVALAEAGAQLALCARSLEGLEETAEQVERAGGRRPHLARVDVTEPDEIAAFMAGADRELGGLHVLLNNAGTERHGLAKELSYPDWSAVLRTNLDAVFLFSQQFARLAGEGGAIVNIASIGSAVGVATQSAYAASKAGVAGLTKSLALELARDGIRVNALAPGYFATDMPREILADEQATQRLLRQVPLRRMGEPEEIGAPIVFLASEASAFMTGSVLYFDGGYTAR